MRRLALRKRFAGVFDRLGMSRLFLQARARGYAPSWLTVLTYHRVHEGIVPFDPGVVDATPAQFNRQLDILKRYFSIVRLDDIRAFLLGKRAMPKNPILLTFDDGYRDCLDVIAPILKRHGATGAFFIATDFISDRKMFWWDRISYILHHCRLPSITIRYPREEVFPLGEHSEKSRRALLRVVKDHFGLNVERFLAEVGRAAEVELTRADEQRLADELVMTWDHVRALSESGMDVQSHTKSHRVLQTVPSEQFDDELLGSRVLLEREIARPVWALAYPTGRNVEDSPVILDAVRRAGYELAFCNGSGINPSWGRFDPLTVRRLAMDAQYSDSYFRGIMAVPALV